MIFMISLHHLDPRADRMAPWKQIIHLFGWCWVWKDKNIDLYSDVKSLQNW